MNKDCIFLFDLDSTITKAEILPTIAKSINKEKQMRELTEKTMMGEFIFEESLNKRVNLLKDIPIDEVANIVENIPVNEKLIKFLKENKKNCYIVTSNLDVWIYKLMKKIGMEENFFCSKADVENNHIVKIGKILVKEEVALKFKNCNVIAVGDGNNDRMMLKYADISIGYGGVRNIAPALFDIIDYAIFNEEKLYELLNKFINNDNDEDKTLIIACAGMGRRLGMKLPKALLKIDGKSLIIRNLELFEKCKDIRIVVGYKAEKIINLVNNYRKNIIFVFNHNYMNNGTSASVLLASKYANQNILAIDGDLLIHPLDVDKILEENEEFVGVCNISSDEPVLVSTKNSKVQAFSRENGEYEWNGICLIKKSNLTNCECYVYQLLENLLPLKYKIIRTKEIDTLVDFKMAEKWVKNNFSDNITIGIIGGMGSYATVEFFRRIVDAFPAEKEWDRPRIIIDNRCNMPSRVRAILYNERKNELVKSIAESIRMMIKNNVDYIVLACNTSHVFLDEIYQIIPEAKNKIINIIDECAKVVKNSNINKIKLYASEGTIQTNIYNKFFEKYNIELENITTQDYTLLRKWIEAVKISNITEEIKKSFIDKINNEKNVILGCTELPILYDLCKEDIHANVIDPLECVINLLLQLNS